MLDLLGGELAATGTSLFIHELPDVFAVFPALRGQPESAPVKPFPPMLYDRMKIVLYLHSSGSVGLPKPIALREVQMLQWCSSGLCSLMF